MRVVTKVVAAANRAKLMSRSALSSSSSSSSSSIHPSASSREKSSPFDYFNDYEENDEEVESEGDVGSAGRLPASAETAASSLRRPVYSGLRFPAETAAILRLLRRLRLVRNHPSSSGVDSGSDGTGFASSSSSSSSSSFFFFFFAVVVVSFSRRWRSGGSSGLTAAMRRGCVAENATLVRRCSRLSRRRGCFFCTVTDLFICLAADMSAVANAAAAGRAAAASAEAMGPATLLHKYILARSPVCTMDSSSLVVFLFFIIVVTLSNPWLLPEHSRMALSQSEGSAGSGGGGNGRAVGGALAPFLCAVESSLQVVLTVYNGDEHHVLSGRLPRLLAGRRNPYATVEILRGPATSPRCSTATLLRLKHPSLLRPPRAQRHSSLLVLRSRSRRRGGGAEGVKVRGQWTSSAARRHSGTSSELPFEESDLLSMPVRFTTVLSLPYHGRRSFMIFMPRQVPSSSSSSSPWGPPRN